MTQEEIRDTWKEGTRNIRRPDEREIELLLIQRKETALERLKHKYRNFSILGLVMAIISINWIFTGSRIFENNNAALLIGITFCCYFGVCSVIDYFLLRGISAINCITMPVNEVAEKSLRYRKIHLRSLMFLLPFAFICIGVMAFAFRDDKYTVYGIIFGAVLGIIIGSFQLREFMVQYRRLTL